MTPPRWTESKRDRWTSRCTGYLDKLYGAAAAAEADGAHEAASHLRRAADCVLDAQARFPHAGQETR